MRGIQTAKLVFDLGGDDEQTVMLGYYNVVKNKPELLYFEHEGSIDGERDSRLKAVHVSFDFDVNLWKYGTPGSKFNEIMGLLGKKFVFWLHKDGLPFKKISGDNALFIIKEYEEYYKTTTDWKDGLKITIESQNPIDPLLPDPIVVEPSEIIMTPGVYL
jgi:hypothetical protein